MRATRVNSGCSRLLDRGLSEFRTSDLLAIVLAGKDVGEHELEAIARSIDVGALASAAASPDELAMGSAFERVGTAVLMAIFELSRRAALAELPAVVRSQDDVAAIARRELGGLRREHVIVITCDAMNRHQRTVTVAAGAVDRSPMPVREILNAVLRWDGRAFAVAHNHPGGHPEPSEADVAATQQLAEAARVVGLRFLGHVVLAGTSHHAVDWVSGTRTPG